MNDDMVDAVAQAIYEAPRDKDVADRYRPGWNDLAEVVKRQFRQQARHAINAYERVSA